MSLTNPNALLDMLEAHTRATRRAARRIADAGVDRLERNVQRRTPIDTNPYRRRPERPRGALRRSIRRRAGVEFVVRGRRELYRGLVETFDPVARYVEFDTPPHTIEAKRPGGYLLFQSRYGFTDRDGHFHPPGTWVQVRQVNHPGTKGAHMFTLGAWATERQLAAYARDAVMRWKAEVESVHV